jgi:hypothetical protein
MPPIIGATMRFITTDRVGGGGMRKGVPAKG